MRRLICVAALATTGAAFAQDALLEAGADRLIARVEVPSPARRVGEVRLVKRGDADVVQTLLYSKVLSRVVAEIREKEAANWPPGREGHDDMKAYVEALDRVRKRIWEEQPKDERRADRRQRLLIEFVLGERDALVAVGSFEMDETEAAPRVTSRRADVVLRPAREYVRRNMRLIAADSFHREGADLDALLAPLPRVRAGSSPGDGK